MNVQHLHLIGVGGDGDVDRLATAWLEGSA